MQKSSKDDNSKFRSANLKHPVQLLSMSSPGKMLRGSTAIVCAFALLTPVGCVQKSSHEWMARRRVGACGDSPPEVEEGRF